MPRQFRLPPNYLDQTRPRRKPASGLDDFQRMRPVGPGGRRPPASAPPPQQYYPPPQPYYGPPASAYRPPPPPPPRRGCVPPLAWFAVGVAAPIAAVALALLALIFFVPQAPVNVLLLGLDQRPGETGPSRTDTMILSTVNPARPYIGMLSIPRDLWVTIPGRGENRVNTAHFFAEAEQEGSGPQAAVETVSANFGVPVERWVRLDLAGFVRIIDSVGGIDLDVPAPLIDYEYPTYDYGITTVEFQAGPQHMDGERALAYARIRHGSSDFKRAERQGLVIQAFARRLLQPSAWPYLPNLIVAVQSSVETNIDPVTALRLVPALVRVGPDGIDRRVIQGDMVRPFTTAAGAAVQMPVWERINPVLLEMFGS
jgi:LCP family protein required for cell wall assembly